MTILVCTGWGWGGGFWRLEGWGEGGGWKGEGFLPPGPLVGLLVEKYLNAYCVPGTKGGGWGVGGLHS